MSIFSSPASSPASSPSLFQQIREMNSNQGAWVRNGDVIPEMELPPPAERTIGDDLIVSILTIVRGEVNYVSPDEIARTRNMLALHKTTPQRTQSVVSQLAYGIHEASNACSSAERRVALAAVAGIVIGLEPNSAQRLVDQARNKPLGEILSFVAKEAAAVGVVAGATVGGLWLSRTGTAYAAKGKFGAMVTAKYGLGTAFNALSGVGTFVAGTYLLVGGVKQGMRMLESNHAANRHLAEATLQKDIRILAGLQRGVLELPNHPPARGGAQ